VALVVGACDRGERGGEGASLALMSFLLSHARGPSELDLGGGGERDNAGWFN